MRVERPRDCRPPGAALVQAHSCMSHAKAAWRSTSASTLLHEPCEDRPPGAAAGMRTMGGACVQGDLKGSRGESECSGGTVWGVATVLHRHACEAAMLFLSGCWRACA